MPMHCAQGPGSGFGSRLPVSASARLGLGLGFGCLLSFRLDLAWISDGFWLRLDFGLIPVWLGFGIGLILVGFSMNFHKILLRFYKENMISDDFP